MSSHSLPCPDCFQENSSLAIVASVFNKKYTDALVENCLDELKILAPNADSKVIRVPGAYEIPVAARAIASAQVPPQVIITFGVIIRGGTEHGDLIAGSVTTALQDIAITSGIPVINQVLLVNDEDQACERCMEAELNRGREGARAAVSMLNTLKELKTLFPR